ncbi:hypothetical protein [Conexibacter sp. DBS9H8]|uniref:hypothetical protein n=1 Tax=Conexibacter sp. DBS9H8 TaxID=2937801 RepID=UPI0020101149|nr:hypothetical protein [Conexibacter sp. DBS9H8]
MSPPSPHADRFRVLLAALLGIGVGAIAIAAAVVIAHGRVSSQNANARTPRTLEWSSWHPSAGGNEGATQIADYIAPFYRLTNSQQLAVVTPVNVTQLTASGSFTGNGLTVALNTASAGSAPTLRPLSGETVAYDLCGQGGPNCALGGTPSTLRLLLLRREALELAMYTFEYLPKSENVVAVLPPGRSSASTHGHPVTVAVLFVRSEIAPLLAQPADATLQEYPPTLAQLKAWKQTTEAGLVDTITSRNLFAERVETEQTGSNLLVLNPLPAQ